MKVLILLTLFTLSQIILISCDNIPRGRPTFYERDTSSITDGSETEVELPVRPSGAIIVQPDHCGCKGGVPITLGNCEAICNGNQSTGDILEKLFFNVELTEAITLDTYENVFGWCKDDAIDPATGTSASTGHGCFLEVKNENGSIEQEIEFNPQDGATSFAVDITSLDEDKTFRVTVVERISQARSTTFQLRKFSSLISGPSGPLQLMPINRYSCMIKTFTTDPNGGQSTTITDVNRFHLFFNSETRPEPLQEATTASFYCHDIEAFQTPVNSPLLEETAGVFALWFKDDPRFFDLIDGDGIPDINNLLEQEVNLQGVTLAQTPNIFAPLNWISALDDTDVTPGGSGESSSTVNVINKELGYYMSPFLDNVTYQSYCPTVNHYYSSSPLFRAMREVIGVGTEALYVAKEDNVTNYLLINESTVKDIWFHIVGGQNIQPTNETIQGKQIYFYWPADPASPYIKKSHQRIYTIKSAEELSGGDSGIGNTTSNTGGVRVNYPTHDKRIGCIPILAQ